MEDDNYYKIIIHNVELLHFDNYLEGYSTEAHKYEELPNSSQRKRV